MNGQQIIFITGAVVGILTGACGGFVLGMNDVLNDKQYEKVLKARGYWEGYKACLEKEEKRRNA
jgi:hypothetical protein